MEGVPEGCAGAKDVDSAWIWMFWRREGGKFCLWVRAEIRFDFVIDRVGREKGARRHAIGLAMHVCILNYGKLY